MEIGTRVRVKGELADRDFLSFEGNRVRGMTGEVVDKLGDLIRVEFDEPIPSARYADATRRSWVLFEGEVEQC